MKTLVPWFDDALCTYICLLSFSPGVSRSVPPTLSDPTHPSGFCDLFLSLHCSGTVPDQPQWPASSGSISFLISLGTVSRKLSLLLQLFWDTGVPLPLQVPFQVATGGFSSSSLGIAILASCSCPPACILLTNFLSCGLNDHLWMWMSYLWWPKFILPAIF